ncbi:uncharacterized protein LOC127773949 [Oryza glaberrima]|nr:uncharacterized protein LOC127773949 [Oryza glaberrima]
MWAHEKVGPTCQSVSAPLPPLQKQSARGGGSGSSSSKSIVVVSREMEALAGGRPLSGRARQVGRSREEELLGLLSDFSGDSGEFGRELSFSDLVVVEDTANNPSPRGGDGGGDREAPTAAAAENGQGRPSSSSEQEEAAEAASRRQQQQQAAAAARERRLRRRRSDSRGSCGGSGDGVLLNFYVPGLLTRSMTTPRPAARGTLPGAAAAAAAPATAAAGKARMDAPLAVGCWPALWGGGGRRDRRKPAKPAAGRRDTRVVTV